jgi:hypothetical protein
MKAGIEQDYKNLEDILQKTAVISNYYKSLSFKLERTLKESTESLLLHSEFDFNYLDDLTDETRKIESLRKCFAKIKDKTSHKTNILLDEFLEANNDPPVNMETLDKIYRKLLHHLIETDQNLHTYDLSDYTTPRKPDFTECTPHRNSLSGEKDSSNPNSAQKYTIPLGRRTHNKTGSKSMWDANEYPAYPEPANLFTDPAIIKLNGQANFQKGPIRKNSRDTKLGSEISMGLTSKRADEYEIITYSERDFTELGDNVMQQRELIIDNFNRNMQQVTRKLGSNTKGDHGSYKLATKGDFEEKIQMIKSEIGESIDCRGGAEGQVSESVFLRIEMLQNENESVKMNAINY